jgi:heterodisulfide reductase subunit B
VVIIQDENKVQMFWGCFIPFKFPWLEKSIRSTLGALKVDFVENSRFTCCAEPSLKNIDEHAWYLTAGRNLAVAEQAGRDILTPCNGCFETMKSLKIMMRENDATNKKVNQMLAKLEPPLDYNNSVDIHHLVEYLWRIKEDIKDQTQQSLEDLNVAVHYGCHLIRPSREIQLDNPFEPKILDELVKLVGAHSLEYTDKLLCCGGSYERAGNKEASLSTVQRKLQHMKDAGAEAVVVSCPNCYLQYEYEQLNLQKLDINLNLPVFFISDLIGLALGLDPDALGMGEHVIDTTPALAKIGAVSKTRTEMPEGFDIDQMERCIRCSACLDDCPPSKLGLMDPPKIFKQVISGNIDAVIHDPSIWACLDCYTCLEMCPDRDGFVGNLKKLRNIASKAGCVPKGFEHQEEVFKKNLRVIPASKSKRKALGLPEVVMDADDLKAEFKNGEGMND